MSLAWNVTSHWGMGTCACGWHILEPRLHSRPKIGATKHERHDNMDHSIRRSPVAPNQIARCPLSAHVACISEAYLAIVPVVVAQPGDGAEKLLSVAGRRECGDEVQRRVWRLQRWHCCIGRQCSGTVTQKRGRRTAGAAGAAACVWVMSHGRAWCPLQLCLVTACDAPGPMLGPRCLGCAARTAFQ
jgi:hypothetical protein